MNETDFCEVLQSHQQQLMHGQVSALPVLSLTLRIVMELAGTLVSEQLLRKVTSALCNLSSFRN